jgi:hypothetical protein
LAEEEKPEPEPEKPTIEASLEELKKSQSGLYSEMKTWRERAQDAERQRTELLAALKKQADAEKALKAEEEIPDREEDPAGYITAVSERRFKALEERFEEERQSREELAQREAFQTAVSQVNSAEARFAEEKKDYYDALEFARGERRRLTKATHPHMTDEDLEQNISYGDQLFALQSVQQGINPAQRAYEYAVRLGYRGKAAGTEAVTATPVAAQAVSTAPVRSGGRSLSASNGAAGGRGQKITSADLDGLDTPVLDALLHNERKMMELDAQGFTYL